MPSRRQVLAGLGGASVVALAGCFGDDPEPEPKPDPESESETETEPEPIFTPGSDADADWPMPRFDPANTAYSPDAKAPRDGARERWTFDGASACGPPVVADGTVFLPTVEALVALDARDGSKRWRFAPPDEEDGGSPWPAAPVVHGGTVFVTDIRTGVHALDAETGGKRWSRTNLGHVHASPHLVAGEGIDDPALHVGTRNGAVHRLDPRTGKTTWRTDSSGAISAFGYRSRTLYAGTVTGGLRSFAAPAGGRSPERNWERSVGSKVRAIVPGESRVLVHTLADRLLFLGEGDEAGATRRTVDERWAGAAPVRAEGFFVTAGSGGLASFREDGDPVRDSVGGYAATGPVVAGDTLYASSGDAVHAFALRGTIGGDGIRFGTKRWSHPTPAAAVEGLAVADGALFAACEGRSGHRTALYCLESA